MLLVTVALSTYVERRVAGFIQDRSGPNRVGPIGLLQVLADGAKFLLKEEVAPAGASKAFFFLAPALALIPATVLFAVIPVAAPMPTQCSRSRSSYNCPSCMSSVSETASDLPRGWWPARRGWRLRPPGAVPSSLAGLIHQQSAPREIEDASGSWSFRRLWRPRG